MDPFDHVATTVGLAYVPTTPYLYLGPWPNAVVVGLYDYHK